MVVQASEFLLPGVPSLGSSWLWEVVVELVELGGGLVADLAVEAAPRLLGLLVGTGWRRWLVGALH